MSQETEYFHGLSTEDAKRDRATLRDIVLKVYGWIGVACLVFLVLLAATWPTGANAAPMFQAQAEGVKIVIYDEPCKLDAVSNLKHRATWHEKGKVYEGCAGAHPAFPIIMGYFADKTVVALPVEMFTRVSGA